MMISSNNQNTQRRFSGVLFWKWWINAKYKTSGRPCLPIKSCKSGKADAAIHCGKGKETMKYSVTNELHWERLSCHCCHLKSGRVSPEKKLQLWYYCLRRIELEMKGIQWKLISWMLVRLCVWERNECDWKRGLFEEEQRCFGRTKRMLLNNSQNICGWVDKTMCEQSS